MGKIYLYYKKHNSSQFGDILKVKIDDSIVTEVEKNSIYELELSNGMHNIKMYYEGWSSEEIIGYIDQNIEINGDTYYIYKGPTTLYGKGKLIKKSFNTPDEFKKYVSKSNKIYKILGVILFIIAILSLIIF